MAKNLSMLISSDDSTELEMRFGPYIIGASGSKGDKGDAGPAGSLSPADAATLSTAASSVSAIANGTATDAGTLTGAEILSTSRGAGLLQTTLTKIAQFVASQKLAATSSANLLPNSSGELGNVLWASSVFGATQDTLSSGTIFTNGAAITSGSSTGDNSVRIPVIPGSSINISGEMNMQAATAGYAQLRINFYDANNNLLSGMYSPNVYFGSSWTYVTRTGVVPANTAYMMVQKAAFNSPLAPANGIQFRRIKVEVGVAPSTYSIEADAGMLPSISSAFDPVFTNIPPGTSQVWKNTTTGVTSLWYNDGGNLSKVALTPVSAVANPTFTTTSVFSTDWSTGFDARLDLQQIANSNALTTVVPPGSSTLMMSATINKASDYTGVVNGLPRAEAAFQNIMTFQQLQEYVINWSIYIPPGYQFDTLQGEVITQIHQGQATGYPTFELSIDPSGQYAVYSRTFNTNETISTLFGNPNGDVGTLVNWQLHYIPDGTGYTSVTELRKNGVPVFTVYGKPNSYAGDSSAYFKMGLYKSDWNTKPSSVTTRTLYFGPMSITQPTGNARNLAFNGPAPVSINAALGGGGVGLKSVGVLAVSSSAQTVTGTTSETVLGTIVIPANTISQGFFRLTSQWDVTNNANVKTCFVRIDGGQARTFPITGKASYTDIFAFISRGLTANSQVSPASGAAPYASSGGASSQWTLDMTKSHTVTLSAQLATSTDSVTLQSFLMEVGNQ